MGGRRDRVAGGRRPPGGVAAIGTTTGRRSPLALWSAPRSRSTVFFRMMLERRDLLCLHEPFCNIANDGSTEADGLVLDSTGRLIDVLLELSERRTVFFKDTTDCRYDVVFERPDFLRNTRHAFLLRDPREIIPSFAAMKPDMAVHEVGVEYLHRIYRAVLDAGGDAVVLDSDDFVDHPERTARAYCSAVGLPFDAGMLSWRPGDRPEWRQSAPWHVDVGASSTVRRRRTTYDRTIDTDPLLRGFYEHHLPFYEYLRQRRVRIV
ncbi:sulfotransferase family protein [Sphaerimonospora mesophila]|uniref:sulfotransferase-like domain-containing protein n=1 Tax=Sphaerimonospora mesophila TaxID=37483 RepID=UPI0022856D05